MPTKGEGISRPHPMPVPLSQRPCMCPNRMKRSPGTANVRPSVLFRGPIGGRPSGLLLRTFQEVAEEVVVSLLAPCRAGHHVRSAVYKRVQFRDLHVRTVRHNVCRQRPPDSLERRVGTKPPFDCWTKVIWRDITRIITPGNVSLGTVRSKELDALHRRSWTWFSATGA